MMMDDDDDSDKSDSDDDKSNKSDSEESDDEEVIRLCFNWSVGCGVSDTVRSRALGWTCARTPPTDTPMSLE